jgi:uncharacterized protein (DUF2235 family)
MKRLIVCCDGTWNTPEKLDPEDVRPTNVLKISRAIRPRDQYGIVQSVEYVRGIGTGNFLNKIVGGISGKGISSNILQGYQFISNNFEPGDHIFLFGFSRGAYTARSLSGLLYHFGILKKQYQSTLPNLYDLYQRTDKAKLPALVSGYRDMLDKDLVDRERQIVPIHFLGVWDTVGALGVPMGLFQRGLKARIGFHDTELAPNVDYAYHALAIHEFRANFPPTLWTERQPHQKVEQVWFPGAHSDIGGGLAETGLSNATLLWMAGRAADAGLEMNLNFLDQPDFQPRPLAAVSDSRGGIYELSDAYERPIGPRLDKNKGKSLAEFRHRVVTDRLHNLPPGILGGREPHEKQVDEWSERLDLAASPVYIAGGKWK